MKSSQQILGLPVLSIEEGRYIGAVKHLVINPKPGRVDYILVEDKTWYKGLKALAFKDIQGIGETALTVAGASSLTSVAECAGAVNLMEKNISLPGLKVLSNKGRLIGIVNEYFIDDNGGEIISCEFKPSNSELPSDTIPRKSILTFGCDFLIVEDGAGEKPAVEPDQHDFVDKTEDRPETLDQHDFVDKSEDQPETPVDKTEGLPETPDLHGFVDETEGLPETVDNEPTGPVNGNGISPGIALKHFEEQQRQYLLGKKVSMRIVADNGEVIAEEGETITDDIIKRAKAADRFIQLTMSIRD